MAINPLSGASSPLSNKNPRLLINIGRAVTRGTLKTFKWLTYTGLVSYALFKTPGTWKATHDVVSFFDYYPKTRNWQKPLNDKYIGNSVVDRFAANYQGFDNVIHASTQANISTTSIDTNQNNILLDTSEEIEILIDELKKTDKTKYLNEIKLLEEINAASRVIWGLNGPNIYDPIQGGRMNCPIMADIQTHLLTTENNQVLKGKILVTKFNPSKENFQMDVVVDTSDGNIYIPYKDLVNWMSPNEITPSHSTDGALYVPILTYAIEKGVTRYNGSTLKWLPSSTITILTGQDYVTMITPTLSDDVLKEVLIKAPQNPTKLVLLQTQWSDLSLKNIKEDFKTLGKFLELDTSYNHSDSKEDDFKNSTIRLLPPETPSEPATSIITFPISIDPATTSPSIPQKNKTEEKDLLKNHVYTVKECKEVDGKWITTIIDANGNEADLNWEQLKRKTFAVVSQSENFPTIGKEGLITLLICLSGLLALRYGCRKVDNCLKPKEKVEHKKG